MSSSEAKALTTGSVFFAIQTGHGEAIDSSQASSDAQDALDVGLSFPSGTPVEIRYVGQALYAHIQASDLLTDIGGNPSQASKFQAETSQLNSYVGGLAALGQGQWVEINRQGLNQISGELKQLQTLVPSAGSTTTTTTPGQLRAETLRLRTELVSAIQSNSTFASLGSSNGRDGYSVTVNVHNLVAALVPDLQSFFAGFPGGSTIASRFGVAPTSRPATQTAVFDVYVSGGKMTEADVDLNQFAGKDKVNFAVPVRMAVAGAGTLSAPSGATQLDLTKLPGLLQALLGSLGKSSA
jgi:hypothetical protein